MFDITTAQDGVISSQGNFAVYGSNLLWDDTKDDEGFFISSEIYNPGEEMKCSMSEDTKDPTFVMLINPLIFTESGDTSLVLIFRTRNGDGSTLKQYQYNGTLTTSA